MTGTVRSGRGRVSFAIEPITKLVPKQREDSGSPEIFDQPIEVSYGKSPTDALGGTRPCDFCMGFDRKTLALCAARTHIVAVR
jgi:hypothetical protein